MISQRPEVKENPINKENLRFILQRAETQQDSLTQKMQRKLGKNHPYSRQAFYVLTQIRTAQFRYLPVSTHSLLRYSDSIVTNDGKFIQRLSKCNWRKFKKIRDREKLKKF